VRPGLVAVDGTRLAGNAGRNRSRAFEQIAREVLAEARATDEAEDERLGDARGDELPEELRTREGRREFFERAKRDGHERQADLQPREPEPRDMEDADAEALSGTAAEFRFDTERIVARVQGREGWLRDARRQLEQQRWDQPETISRSRTDRLVQAAQRLEAELDAERAGNAAYEAYRARGRMKDGRRFGGPPKPYQPPEIPPGQVNVTDPDSKLLKTTEGYAQGYNAQAVVDEGQIVLAAEISTSTVDWSQLDPMITATLCELERAGVARRPETAVADAQYWNEEHIDEVVASKHIQVLIPPDSRLRKAPRPGWDGGRYSWMRAVLAGELGQRVYRNRSQMIEPVFGHTKHNRGVTRLHRRGRAAVRTEWRLLMATHNLTKLHRHQIAAMRA
jgi:hypothetical protein